MANLPLIEYAVDGAEEALAAVLEGADRIELCSRLDLEGLTPPLEEVRLARRQLDVPYVVMIRHHNNGFRYSATDIVQMREQARLSLEAGATGIVTGMLKVDGTVDAHVVSSFVELAEERDTVFHRAFDLVKDQAVALEMLIDCGVARVLTSGGARTAIEGAERIRELVEQADGRIGVVACGGIRGPAIRQIADLTGVTEVHRRYVPPSGGSH